jgi:hypothetical protein
MVGLFEKPRGLFGGPPMDAKEAYGRPPQYMPPEPQQPKEKGDGGRRIAGIIGDFLLGLGGQQGVYGPMMAQQRQYDRRSEQQTQQAEAERLARREEFKYEHDYKRQNPEPRVNDTEQDYQLIERLHGKAAADEFLRNKASPPVYRFGADGLPYRVETQAPEVIGPDLPEGWQIEGGPASAPGGFPRQR